jgi:hypothetical protein
VPLAVECDLDQVVALRAGRFVGQSRTPWQIPNRPSEITALPQATRARSQSRAAQNRMTARTRPLRSQPFAHGTIIKPSTAGAVKAPVARRHAPWRYSERAWLGERPQLLPQKSFFVSYIQGPSAYLYPLSRNIVRSRLAELVVQFCSFASSELPNPRCNLVINFSACCRVIER